MRDEHDFDPEWNEVEVARRRRRRRIALVVTATIIVVVLATVGGYTGWTLTAPLPAPNVTSQEPAVPVGEAAVVALPTEGASALTISGGDEYLGAGASGIWAASGTDEPRSIASITKLVTALVILDAYPLASATDPGPTLTFDKADHDLYDKYYVMGATIADMPIGSSMSLHDALATMLIPSASNYAEAVSTWAFGSQRGFLNATRRWLDANDLGGTTIVEPTGISARNTSTPTDLITLARLATAHPVIASISATRALQLPGPGPIVNTNDLLGTSGITGLKTGNLGPGTYNLLYTASVDVGAAQPLSVTGVVLGGASRQSVNADVISALDGIRAGFHDVQLAASGQKVGSFSTAWGDSARMIVSKDASIFTWSDTPITVEMTTTTPKTYKDGEVVGSITWTAGPKTVTVPVEIEGSIHPPTEWWRLTNPGELVGD